MTSLFVLMMGLLEAHANKQMNQMCLERSQHLNLLIDATQHDEHVVVVAADVADVAERLS